MGLTRAWINQNIGDARNLIISVSRNHVTHPAPTVRCCCCKWPTIGYYSVWRQGMRTHPACTYPLLKSLWNSEHSCGSSPRSHQFLRRVQISSPRESRDTWCSLFSSKFFRSLRGHPARIFLISRFFLAILKLSPFYKLLDGVIIYVTLTSKFHLAAKIIRLFVA